MKTHENYDILTGVYYFFETFFNLYHFFSTVLHTNMFYSVYKKEIIGLKNYY